MQQRAASAAMPSASGGIGSSPSGTSCFQAWMRVWTSCMKRWKWIRRLRSHIGGPAKNRSISIDLPAADLADECTGRWRRSPASSSIGRRRSSRASEWPLPLAWRGGGCVAAQPHPQRLQPLGGQRLRGIGRQLTRRNQRAISRQRAARGRHVWGQGVHVVPRHSASGSGVQRMGRRGRAGMATPSAARSDRARRPARRGTPPPPVPSDSRPRRAPRTVEAVRWRIPAAARAAPRRWLGCPAPDRSMPTPSVPAAIEGEDVERHLARERRDQDLPPAERHRLVRRGEVGAADGVVDNIRAMPVGRRADHGCHVVGRVDGADRRAGITGIGRIAAGDREHTRPVHRGDLHGGLADPAVAAHDHDHLARTWHAGATKSLLRRNKRDTQRAGLRQRQGVRAGDQCVVGQHQVPGVGAVAGDAQVPAGPEYFLPDQFPRPLAHHAGPVAARRARPERVRHGAERSLHVAGVDRRVVHLDQNLVVFARQRGLRFDPQVELVDRGGW